MPINCVGGVVNMIFLKNCIGYCVCAVLILSSFVDPSEAATGPTHGKVVVCYVCAWAVYRPERGSFKLEHVDPNLCTHVVYSFAGLNITRNEIKSLDTWQDLPVPVGQDGYKRAVALKKSHPHLKLTLAIGGWNEGSLNYSLMAAESSRRSQFVSSALEFIRKHNFDGLDLDWEFPGKRGGSPNDKFNFLLLVKELRAAFNKHDLLLTAAFGAGKDTIDIAYDVRGLAPYLDYIHMMCYDYHGAWDKKTGANAPLRSSDVLNVEYTIKYMIELGAPPEKLIMGIPLYGRTFVMAQPLTIGSPKMPRLGGMAQEVGFQGPFTRENGFMGYNEICAEFKNATSNWAKYWDDESSTPFAVNNEKVISYDDENSIAEKVKLAMKNKLGGAMVWSIDTDDFLGDCADGDDNKQGFTNFPLMRAINAAIEKSLAEISQDVDDDDEKKHEKENEIPHGTHDDRKASDAAKIARHYVPLSVTLALIFYRQ